MNIKNTQQNINPNTTITQSSTNLPVQQSAEKVFAEELKNIKKNNDIENTDTIKDSTLTTPENTETGDNVQSEKLSPNQETFSENDVPIKEKEQKNQNNLPDKNIQSKEELFIVQNQNTVTTLEDNHEFPKIEEKNDSTKEKKEFKNPDKENLPINNAINGLQNIVTELNKIGQKDELEEEFVKTDVKFTDKNNKNDTDEEKTLIDNNINIQEPIEKLNVQTEANMNFNSNEQPFSQFINQEQNKSTLKSTVKELAEEKAVLSTMEENIAIANKNMLMKEKTKTATTKEENKNITIQDEKGIKKVDTKTHIIVDTIVSYDNVIMDKNDVDFFVNLVNNGVVNLNEIQNSEKTSQVSKTLADLLAKAMNDNKPIRIDFDNDISVIIKIDRAGKISADFLPSSQIAEAYLKENLPLLKQRFDDNNIDYNELNQRKQKQDSQDNRKKGRKDE